MGVSDSDRIGMALGGDHRAFARLLREHDEAMRRLAGRLVGAVTMDDVLQDAYLKAFLRLDSFAGRSAFRTWLYSIVYRTCIDHLRTAGRRCEVELDENAVGLATDRMADRIVNRSALRQALADLSPDHAAVVLLVDGEGMKYEEVARVLDLAPGTVASRLNRARRQLRAVLQTKPGSDRREGFS